MEDRYITTMTSPQTVGVEKRWMTRRIGWGKRFLHHGKKKVGESPDRRLDPRAGESVKGGKGPKRIKLSADTVAEAGPISVKREKQGKRSRLSELV